MSRQSRSGDRPLNFAAVLLRFSSVLDAGRRAGVDLAGCHRSELAFHHAGLLQGPRCVKFRSSVWHSTCHHMRADSAGAAHPDALRAMTSGAAPKEYGERAETWAARRRTIGRRCILRTGDLKTGVAHGHHDAEAQRARTAKMRWQRRRRGRDGNCHDQRVEEGRVAA